MAILLAATLQGTVKSTDGYALPGVTVTVGETGVVTDAHGRFTLPNVELPATLHARMSGLEPRDIVVTKARSLKIRMEIKTTICAIPAPMLDWNGNTTTRVTPFELSKLPF